MAGMANTAPRPCLFTHSQPHTHIHSLSLVLVAMMKSKEFKTKISHAHSLILSRSIGISGHTLFINCDGVSDELVQVLSH